MRAVEKDRVSASEAASHQQPLPSLFVNNSKYFIMKFSLTILVASLGAVSAFAFNSGSSHAIQTSTTRSSSGPISFKNHFETSESSTALSATAAAGSTEAIKTRGGGALGGIDIRK